MAYDILEIEAKRVAKRQYRKTISAICANCNIPFQADAWRVKHGKGKFCSVDCSHSGRFNNQWKGGLSSDREYQSAKHTKRRRELKEGLYDFIKQNPSVVEKFNQRYRVPPDPVNDCWEWTGSRNEKGYGRLNVRANSISAHRLSYLLFSGDLIDGLVVCHSCDNPGCVNPTHLWQGSQMENMRDAAKKNRLAKGETAHMAKFSNATINRVRALRILGFTYTDIGRTLDMSHGYAWQIVHGNDRKDS